MQKYILRDLIIRITYAFVKPNSRKQTAMNALTIIPPIATLPVCLADAEMTQTLAFAEMEKSAGHAAGLRARLAHFHRLVCRARPGVRCRPHPAPAARFLSGEATDAAKSPARSAGAPPPSPMPTSWPGMSRRRTPRRSRQWSGASAAPSAPPPSGRRRRPPIW